MNHLAHFFLAGEDPGLLIGGFLGDYVKGRLRGERTQAIEAGIKLHRAIDAFTDKHSITRISQQRFEPRFRRFSGIMTDIIYDHFLAFHWKNYHQHDLQTFSNATFRVLLAGVEHFPDTASRSCVQMHEKNALAHYSDGIFVQRSFKYLSGRLSRANPLAEGYIQFMNNRSGLETDFQAFFPELMKFVEHWKAQFSCHEQDSIS